MKKRLIVFDLWKTLCYRESIVAQMMEQFRLPGSYRRNAILFEEAVQKQSWDSTDELFRALALAFSLSQTEDVVQQLKCFFDSAYDGFLEYMHVRTMLKNLKEQGFLLGLISNSSDYAIHLLRKHTDILDLFDVIVFSYEARAIKPDPSIYHALLEKAGVNPSEALMIGDKPTEDVDVPRSLGMSALQFTDYASLRKKGEKEYHITF